MPSERRDQMTKYSFRSIIKSFTLLAFITFLTSCEGFFTNNDVDEKIRAAIDYAKAPFSTFVVSVDSNAGTIIPSGQVQYKPTDLQNIEFTCKPNHEFIEWRFSYKMISQNAESSTLTATDKDWWMDYIKITKQSQSEPNAKGEIVYSLQIQFIKAAENLLIEPVCSLKPEIKTFTPAYKLEGVSRLTQVSIEFNGPIDQDSIFFSQTEITAISGVTEILKNDQNQIYGYEKDGKRYFKNIQILLGSTEIDVNDCFGDFSYRSDINTLFITPKRGVEIVGDVAEVKIVLMNGIKNISGATLTETTKVYCVNKSSNQQADIDIKYNTNSPATHINPFAGIDQEITFPADETVQFLYWKVTANSPESVNKITVYNNSDKTPLMKFCANTVILPSEGVTITAVYKKRPSIVTNGFEPMDQNDGVDKDSDIKIVFDQAIDLASFIAGYRIDCNGNNVKENFNTPVLDSEDSANKTIIIPASLDSTIDVDRGAKKKITVTIPAGLYYSYTDDSDGTVYQITAGEDIVRTYKINSDTKDKLYVSFVLPNNEMGSFNNPGRAYYNRGEKFSILFSEPAYGQSTYQKYQFFGWKIPASATSKIECVQSSSNSMLYEFTVKSGCDASSPVTITADVRERISIVSFTPADSTNGVPKDSDIEITFNKPLPLANCKGLISISCNGQDVPDSFPKSSWTMTGNTLTIPADKSNRLTLNSTPKGRVQVKIDSNLTYTDTDGKIITFKESDRSKSYCINNSTIDFATLTITEDSNEGSITYESKDKYSIGEELTLAFTPDDDYEFLYWQISNTAVGSFTQQKETTTNLTINSEGNATITAKCTPKLKVTSFAPASGAAKPKDSNIVIGFNKNPSYKNNFAASIAISMDGTPLTANFKAAALSGSTVTFEANQANRIQLSGSKEVNVTLQNDLFYEYTDEIITNPRKIYIKETETKTYIIDESTINKATVQVTNGNASAGTIKNSDGNNFTTSTTQYSKDQTFTLNYDLNSAYEFINWTVTGTTSNVELSSPESSTTTVKIIGSTTGTATITANVAPKLALSSMTVNGSTFSDTATTKYPKDSVIVLNFNKPIPTDLTLTDYITLSCGNIPGVSDYYTISSSDSAITLTPKTRLGITADETLNLTVKSSLYYKYSTTKNITLASNVTKLIPLKPETVQRATVEIKNNNPSAGTIKNPNGTNFSTGTSVYNLEDELNLKFIQNDDYEFVYWKVTGTTNDCINNVSVEPVNSPDAKITIKAANSGTVTIEPVCAERLKITSVTINSKPYYPVTVYEKDSPVNITFNKKIKTSNLSDIKLYFKNKETISVVSATDTSKYFKVSESGTSYSTVTFTPVSGKFLDVDSIDLVFIYVPKTIVYNFSDSTTGTTQTEEIAMLNVYDEYYQVSYESRTKFTIDKLVTGGQSTNENTEAAQLLKITPYREDGKYNYGEKIRVTFPKASQNYYTKATGTNSTSSTTGLLVSNSGWTIKDSSGTDTNLNGKIQAANYNTDDWYCDFYVYSAGSSNKMQLSLAVTTTPQLKSVYPVTTNEVKTYPCDTPIIMTFTHPVNKNNVSFGKGNTYGLRVVRSINPSGQITNINNDIEDITNYFSIKTKTNYHFNAYSAVEWDEVIEGDDNTIIIRPKMSLMELFSEIGKEEETIYVLATKNGSYALRDTNGKYLFSTIPTSMTERISYNSSIGYVCIPLTISSSVTNPHLRIKNEKVNFVMGGSSDIPKNTKITITNNTLTPASAIDNQGYMMCNFYIDDSILGNWSPIDFKWEGIIECNITQIASYNKNTTTINNSNLFYIPETKVVMSPYIASESTSSIPIKYTISLGFNLLEYGYTYTAESNPILRLNFKIYHPAFEQPYTTTYYVCHGQK